MEATKKVRRCAMGGIHTYSIYKREIRDVGMGLGPIFVPDGNRSAMSSRGNGMGMDGEWEWDFHTHDNIPLPWPCNTASVLPETR